MNTDSPTAEETTVFLQWVTVSHLQIILTVTDDNQVGVAERLTFPILLMYVLSLQDVPGLGLIDFIATFSPHNSRSKYWHDCDI